MKRKRICFFIVTVFLLSLFGCSPKVVDLPDTPESVSETEKQEVRTVSVDSDLFTSRDLSGEYDKTVYTVKLNGADAELSGKSVVADGKIKITEEGTYLLSGSFRGSVVVDLDGKNDKAQLVLDGAEIVSENSAAIYVKNADKVFITLKDNTENRIETAGEFVRTDENNVDAAVFSKDDLTFNGTGSLIVKCVDGHGIVCKNDLIFTSGNYSVEAASHGICGKTSVRICGGNFTVDSSEDGIRASDNDNSENAFLYISDGNFDIRSGGDGFYAAGTLTVEDGSFHVVTGSGSESVTHAASGFNPFNSLKTETSGVSAKAFKSDGAMTVNGGTFTIDSMDDAFHCGSDLKIENGNFTVSSGDDAIHSDEFVSISGGTVNILRSYEGIEGKSLEISGGEIVLVSSDDGLNAAGGNDSSGFGGFFGGDSFANENCSIRISGGKLTIDASGDGIDSNGNIVVSGGETYVSGPTDNGNGALDYGGTAEITGGIFAAFGSSGMAQSFGQSSTQCAIMVNVASTDGAVSLSDSDGNLLFEYAPEKRYGNVVISIPEIRSDGIYTLKTGTDETMIEMNGTLYGGSGFGFGNPGGNFGGRNRQNGGNPTGNKGNMQRPEKNANDRPDAMPDNMNPPDGMDFPENFDPENGIPPRGNPEPSQLFEQQ